MSKNRRWSSRDGFTLVELMISLSIFGLLLLFMFSFYGREIQTRTIAQNRDQTSEQGVTAMNEIVKVIRQQTGPLSVSGNNLIDPTTGLPIIGTNGLTIQYSPSAQTLTEPTNKLTLANQVQSLQITDSPKTISNRTYHLFAIQLVVLQKGSSIPYELDTKVFKVDPQ